MGRICQIMACGLLLLTAASLEAQDPRGVRRPVQTEPAVRQRPYHGPDRPPEIGRRRHPGQLGERGSRPRPDGPGQPGSHTSGRRRWGGDPIPSFLFKLAEKSPEEQDRILNGNPRFRDMPANEQQKFREKLKRFSAMLPDERQRFRERFVIFHNLPPESRDKIREEVMPAWNRLPADRRRVLLDEFRTLRRLAADERQQRFAQDSFTREFSSGEQQLLRQLTSLSPEQH